MSERPHSRLAITGGTVVTPAAAIEDGICLVEDGKVRFAGPGGDAAPEPGATIVDATGRYVCPGLVDTHVHGSHGDDVMTGGAEGLERISRAQLRYGTTAYLPSTVSAHHDDLLRAIESCVAAASRGAGGAEIVGIHVEGPYINASKKGAQPAGTIRDPDLDECLEYLEAAAGLIKVMTIAPELPGALDLVRLLAGRGVVASLGHSEADYDTALAAVDAGAAHATHLFNAMPALHHRRPTLTAACLVEPAIQVEIILDGFHVAPEMARLAYRMKGRDRMILITDAMAAVGCPDGDYTLGDSKVRVRGEQCLLFDGVTIASSMLTMNRAVGKAVTFTGASLVDAVYMASAVPAAVCGVADRKGSLEAGKDADVAILNPDYSVAMTIRAGEIAHRDGL